MPSYPRWTTKFEIKPGAWVFVPSPDSITNGREIKSAIESRWKPPQNYYHLRNGGHVAALMSHRNSSCFIQSDIKDFFGSINKSRVTRCLKRFFSYKEARRMAVESTVKHPNHTPIKFYLPFGFVQSPIIASLCLFDSSLGRYLNRLAREKDIVVSIYMDDITISLKDEDMAGEILYKVEDQANKSRFILNKTKEGGPAPKITAFNINLSHKNLEIEDRRMAKFIRDYLGSSNPNQQEGYERYINSVNPDQVKQLI